MIEFIHLFIQFVQASVLKTYVHFTECLVVLTIIHNTGNHGTVNYDVDVAGPIWVE